MSRPWRCGRRWPHTEAPWCVLADGHEGPHAREVTRSEVTAATVVQHESVTISSRSGTLHKLWKVWRLTLACGHEVDRPMTTRTAPRRIICRNCYPKNPT